MAEKFYGIESVDAEGNVQLKYKTASWYYKNDPEYKKKLQEWRKNNDAKHRAADPEGYNEKKRIYVKNKYQTDPEYREKKKAQALERYYAKKQSQAQEVKILP